MKLHLKTDFVTRPPAVFRRKPGGAYYVRQRIAGKDVWRSLCTTVKREAEVLAVNIWREQQSASGKAIIPAPQRKIVEISQGYLESEAFLSLADSTRRTRTCNIDSFLAWCEERRLKYLEQVTSDAATEYLESRGKKNKTFNNLLGELRVVFDTRGADVNPFAAITPRAIHKGEKASSQFRALSDAEVQKILDALPTSKLENRNEWAHAVRIASQTGLRYKDIALLRWESLKSDALGEYLELAPHKTEAKTGGKVVYIRLTNDLHNLFYDLRAADLLSMYVLPKLATKYKQNPNVATLPFSVLLKRLEIDNASFHCLRVSVITKAAKAGINLEEFGGVVGHTTEEQTQAYNRAALNIDMEKVLSVSL